jgi:hypothetical protein
MYRTSPICCGARACSMNPFITADFRQAVPRKSDTGRNFIRILTILVCLGLPATTVARLLQEDLPANRDPAARVFRYQDSETQQILRVHFLSKRKIHFVLSVDEDCHKRIEGTAINHAHGYTIDADEAGEFYLANEFIYRERNGHTLYIRIAARTKRFKSDKAYVSELKDRSGCPATEDIMQLERMGLHLIDHAPPVSGTGTQSQPNRP